MTKILPRRCCSAEPSVFSDTKVGETVQKRVINCARCGKYSDGATTTEAIWYWNRNFKFTNPIDTEFVQRLKRGKI